MTFTFTIAILMLGFAAFIGGLLIRKVGPRPVGIASGVAYGAGIFLGSQASHGLWILYLTYGVLGGIGLGLGYIVPVTTLLKWFPDKRGFISGIAVAGFGAGALITAPIAARLILSEGVLTTFAILGIAYFIMVVGSALSMTNLPEGWTPPGWHPSSAQTTQRVAVDFTLNETVRTWQWYAQWAILFLNVTAGMAIISQAAPMGEEITHVDAIAAAGMVSIISIANGTGRFLWAWLSDFIGRRWVFLILFLLQAAMFTLPSMTTAFIVFTVLASIIISCCGGTFATMPAFAADYFGPKDVGSVYGLMLTAWGFAGVSGPLLIASIRESTGPTRMPCTSSPGSCS